MGNVLFPIIIFSSQEEDKNNKWFYFDCIVLVFSGFTGPNFIVLLPLFLFLLLSSKNNNFRKLLYLLAIITGVLGFLALVSHGSVNRVEGHFTLLNQGFIQFIFVQYAFLFIGKLAFKMPFIVMCLGAIGVFGFYLYAFKKSLIQYNQKIFLFICITASLLFLGITLIQIIMLEYKNYEHLCSKVKVKKVRFDML